MKLQLFGKEAEIRTEVAVIVISALALLGMLIGYAFFRDTGDIIIEAGTESQENKAATDSNVLVECGTVLTDVKENTKQKNGSAQNKCDTVNETGSAAAQKSGTSEETGAASENTTTDIAIPTIQIYVVGCVNKPGIITLEKGSMICDAVSKAGGLTDNADKENINMVYSLNENSMLYIKSKKDDSSALGKGANVILDSSSGAEVIGKGDDMATEVESTALININTAGADVLDTLPGIGEATAMDIIAYRDKYGSFATVEDIMKVPRIKDKRFESIRDFITVE